MARVRFRGLVDQVAAAHPEIDDIEQAISDGRVQVDGTIMRNPNARVRADAAIVLRADGSLRGEAKLRGALEAFDVNVAGRVALDAGASAGGFTRVLLDAGAAAVYAVDAGHGQLIGSLRQDPRVVNLEATNIGDLTPALVPNAVDVVTLDLSYLSIAAAVPQLEAIELAPDADLITLIKPMFELGLDTPPRDADRLDEAVELAAAGIARGQWTVVARAPSPVPGANGAIEFFIHSRRRPELSGKT